MMAEMPLVETHEAADACIMKAVASFWCFAAEICRAPELVTPLEAQSDPLANTHA
jgi:hypothetical protein